MPLVPTSNCIPPNTPAPGAQTLSLDCGTGNLAISNGNEVNLACIVTGFQTVSTFNSLTLTGTILQAIITFEDGIPQAKNVDLSSLVPSSNSINVANSNTLLLSFASNTLSGQVNIDPASTLPISASGAGIKFGCCPETPVTVNNTNTITLTASGSLGHTLTSNLKYQNSASVLLSSTSSGLIANVNYSTQSGNAALSGTDGGVYVASLASQIASYPNNGFATTGSSGTLLIGSDSKLYRIPTPAPQTTITAVNTNTVNTTVTGGGFTIQSSVNLANSPTVTLSATSGGVQANVVIDTVTPGNVTITSDSNGLKANITETSVASVQTTAATVQNPMTAIFGTLNSGAGGFATASLSQYGLKFPSFSTTQRLAIPTANLYDTLFVFDNTIRAFMWYDAINSVWVQIS